MNIHTKYKEANHDRKDIRKPQRGAPAYHRLTRRKRSILWALKREGFSQTQMARRLGVSKSTVSRELRRNATHWGYRYQFADAQAKARASAKATKRRKFTEAMWEWAMSRLWRGWSFGIICGRAGKEGVPMVCAETLYAEYYRRQKLVAQGESGEVLPPLPKAHRKRHRRGKRYANAGRGRIPGRVDISEWPKEVEQRKEAGHWEGDLDNGAPGTGHLVTLVERTTRFTCIRNVANKKDDEVAAAVVARQGTLPQGLLKTLTFDNGKEFAKFKRIEKKLGFHVYFAKPYHSWERGTNENRNGVVRKVLPKGTSFLDIADEDLRKIDALLNDRPLRCLKWRTPREAFGELLKGGPGVA